MAELDERGWKMGVLLALVFALATVCVIVTGVWVLTVRDHGSELDTLVKAVQDLKDVATSMKGETPTREAQSALRVTHLYPVANHITPNADITDVAFCTFSAALHIENPVATGSNPVNQQLLALELHTGASQPLTFGTAYSDACGLPLPTHTTGDGLIHQRWLFRYAEAQRQWCLVQFSWG